MKIFIKSFLLKIFTKFSKEFQRRSSEEWDIVKILREIAFLGRSQKRFGSWEVLNKSLKVIKYFHFINEKDVVEYDFNKNYGFFFKSL